MERENSHPAYNFVVLLDYGTRRTSPSRPEASRLRRALVEARKRDFSVVAGSLAAQESSVDIALRPPHPTLSTAGLVLFGLGSVFGGGRVATEAFDGGDVLAPCPASFSGVSR